MKTVERIIKILLLSDRPIIIVFRHQGLLRKSDGFTPNGGAMSDMRSLMTIGCEMKKP